MATRTLTVGALIASTALLSFLPAAASVALEPPHPTIVNWALSASEISTSCKAAIDTARKQVAALASAPAPHTFSNTVLKLENLNSDMSDNTLAQTFLGSVSPDKKIRDASQKCQDDESAFGADETAIPAIYQALAAAKKSNTAHDVYDRALTDLWIQDYQRSGAGLPKTARERFVALSKQLNDLQTQFDQNVADDTTTTTIAKADIAGFPSDLLSTLKFSPDRNGFIVPVNDSTVGPFLNNVASAAARKQYYLSFMNIAYPANVKLLEDAISVRSQLANLLGYPNWAAYQMAPRTVSNPAKIVDFLQKLDAHLLPQARKDVAVLAALKAKDLHQPNATIDAWDVAYYLNDLAKTKYAVDENEVRQYFPAPHVVSSILGIYQRILGVTFTEVEKPNSWYPNVTEFDVNDTATGKFLGEFLLDLYPRDGKPGGAFNQPILPVRRNADGTNRPPISTIIVSDWPAPVGDKPALLTHDDVVTFFHEFGHNMAALLATTPYESLDQFQQDFVEAPSQMLENFTWDPTILKQISSNVDTGAPLPDALIHKLIAARCVEDGVCSAFAAVGQIKYALIDLDYHMAGPKVDTTAIWTEDSAKYTPVAQPPGTHRQASFTHYMSGYDAGYYVYLWSLVYAQDIFTAFKKGGLDSAVVGARYRDTILAPGRTLSPDVEVKNFLGRPMDPSAFYNGFDQATPAPTQ